MFNVHLIVLSPHRSLPDNSDKAEGGSPDGQQGNSVTGLHGLGNHGNTSLATLQVGNSRNSVHQLELVFQKLLILCILTF